MIIILVCQGIPLDKIVMSLLFYNIHLDVEKYSICLICNSYTKDYLDNYMISFRFNIIYKIINCNEIKPFVSKFYTIQRDLINEYGSILLANPYSILLSNIDISEELLNQKIIILKNNNSINKKLMYISDADIVNKIIFNYEDLLSKDISGNVKNIDIFNLEMDLIDDVYKKNDYKYFEQNHLMSSLYQFTKEGNEKKYINWDKLTFKDKPIQYYNIEIANNPFYNKLVTSVIEKLFRIDSRYYYIFLFSSTKNNDISIPLRNYQIGAWSNSNNSFDFIIKSFVNDNNKIFNYNFSKRYSYTDFIKNNVIYDKINDSLIDIYTLTYNNIFLVNTNNTVIDTLDSIKKKYYFLGYIPYCKPLLDEYIQGIVTYEKTDILIDISNTEYDDSDIQKYINCHGILDINDTDNTTDIDTKQIKRDKHKELYFLHLNKVKNAKYVKLNIDDKRFINTFIECMILKSIPVLDKEPNLFGLYKDNNYIIYNDDIDFSDVDDNIISNNELYYNENVNIDHCKKMIEYLVY